MISYTTPIAESNNFIVLDKYTKEWQVSESSSEHLNIEAAKRYISTSLKREFASDNGTELNTILPKMSPLNPAIPDQKTECFSKNCRFC